MGHIFNDKEICLAKLEKKIIQWITSTYNCLLHVGRAGGETVSCGPIQVTVDIFRQISSSKKQSGYYVHFITSVTLHILINISINSGKDI